MTRTRWDDIAAGKVTFPVNETMGFRLEPSDEPEETISYTWTIPHEYSNSEGNLQGGVMAAFADAVLGGLCASELPHDFYPALAEMKISFLRPASAGSTITATGRVLRAGKRLIFVEAEITSEDGKMLAKVTGTEIPAPATP